MHIDQADPFGDPEAAQSAERPYFVGIGSSAGGLEALTAMLPALPSGLGLRYVVVQHLSPTHPSMMATLLGRVTTMDVLEVEDGCLPMADKIYVTPPNKNVTIAADGRLRLQAPPHQNVPKPSANLFFTSLAEVMSDRAIGVVLSGTGSDGAAGLHAIKAAGGYALAQEPAKAKYDGMVRAAIEAGGVDWILPAEQMGAEMGRIVQRQRDADALGSHQTRLSPGTLQALLHSLYAQTRIDFSGYKEATLLRRIDRRMTSTRCVALDQYVEFARNEPKELQALAQDMLISVTSFFRDRLAFERLRTELATLLRSKPSADDLRIWVPGCASGEEAYSLAMVLHDLVVEAGTPRRVQIFATDIDERALARARRGVYPATLLSDLDAETVDRHFQQHADGFEVNKQLRSIVMFARHNLVQDPPFVRLDLISCRNVLIYMQAALQERVMRTFQYALNRGGLLFLGRSEGVHASDGDFDLVDRNAHLFRRSFGARQLPVRSRGVRDVVHTPVEAGKGSLDDLILRVTAQRFSPASLLVDMAGEVRHVKGDLSEIMTLPQGRPGFNLMSLLNRELRPELARLTRAAQQADLAIAVQRPAGRSGDASAPPVVGRWRNNRAVSRKWQLRMSAQMLCPEGSTDRLMLICFERKASRDLAAASASDLAGVTDRAERSPLEDELATAREHLQTVVEELETSNEESQSLNEEIQTTNEELQSTNEELEASNEELAATNEELTTVNDELQVKNLELLALTTELAGIYATVDFPLLAFDEHFVLARVNRAVQQQLGVDNSWIGKPAHRLPWPRGMPPILADLELAQAQRQSVSRQLLDVGSRHWSLRIMPRLNQDGGCLGTLVHMEDNTRLRESEGAALRIGSQLRQLVNRSAQLLCICDTTGRLQLANPEFERLYRVPQGMAVGRLIDEVLPHELAGAFRDACLEAIRKRAPTEMEEAIEVDNEQRHLLASYYPLLDDDGAVSGVCYQALDITRRKATEAALIAATSAQLAAEGMARTKAGFLANMSHEIRTPMNAVLGLSRMALAGPLPDSAREQISQVHSASQALTRILDDVLDFSRLEAGEVRFEVHPLQLNKVLQDLRDLFIANAQEKGLDLRVDMPLGLPVALFGDALRLTQVLNNLVSNALKFTDTGEVRVTVCEVDSLRDGCCKLRFAVRDTGPGIEPALHSQLFDAFVQGDASVTRRHGGTGLGLAICRQLVGLMGGQIGISSHPGQGSEFWFTAEFKSSGGLDTAAPSSPAVGWAPPVLLGSDSVARPALLVEDNTLNQIVARALLEQAGLTVELACDGAQAIEQVRAHPAGYYKVVFMDLHMPVMGGLEATRILRGMPEGRDLPIVAITAATLDEDKSQCLAAGMNDHLEKPLDPAQLHRLLARLFFPSPLP